MKLLTLVLLISAQAFAVRSTTDEIPQFNGQARAQTISQMCTLLTNASLDLGKVGSVSCSDDGNGLMTIQGELNGRIQTVQALADDKLVLEERGFDEVHTYTNDQDEALVITLTFVAEGTTLKSDGTRMNGTFRGDVVLRNADSSMRIGAYINK